VLIRDSAFTIVFLQRYRALAAHARTSPPDTSRTRELSRASRAPTLLCNKQGGESMKSYPRDWIAWMVAAAIVVVAVVELVATATAHEPARTAEETWTTQAVDLA
jgi:hypothetical protein